MLERLLVFFLLTVELFNFPCLKYKLYVGFLYAYYMLALPTVDRSFSPWNAEATAPC